jgi:hypothetical protein
MKVNAFWILSATTLFCLSLIYLHHGYHRRNFLFACWLCFGVCVQLLGAWGLAAGRPAWFAPVGVLADFASYGLGAGVLLVAAMRRNCPVNRILLAGLGAMLVFSLLGRWLGDSLDAVARTWLRNIAFFGPAIFLLIMFSGMGADRLPVLVDSALCRAVTGANGQSSVALAFGPGVRR